MKIELVGRGAGDECTGCLFNRTESGYHCHVPGLLGLEHCYNKPHMVYKLVQPVPGITEKLRRLAVVLRLICCTGQMRSVHSKELRKEVR